MNHPFDREIINLMERPLSSDHNLAYSYADLALRTFIANLYATRTASTASGDQSNTQPTPGGLGAAGFIGSAFKARSVLAQPAMQVQLDAGLGFINDNSQALNIGGVAGLHDLSPLKPLMLNAPMVLNVPAADPVNPRIDIIEVSMPRYLTDATSRDVFSPSAASFVPNTVKKTMSYSVDLLASLNSTGPVNYKTGTPAASPTAPSTDSGYVALAQVYVFPGATGIGASCVMDLRRMLFPGGQFRVSGLAIGGSPSAGFVTMQTLNAPPGVEVAVARTVGFFPNFNVYIKAGDLSSLRLATGPGYYGNVTPSYMNSGVGVGGGGNVGIPTGTTVINANSGVFPSSLNDVNVLGGAQPPMYCMPGQQLLYVGTIFGASGLPTRFDIDIQL